MICTVLRCTYKLRENSIENKFPNAVSIIEIIILTKSKTADEVSSISFDLSERAFENATGEWAPRHCHLSADTAGATASRLIAKYHCYDIIPRIWLSIFIWFRFLISPLFSFNKFQLSVTNFFPPPLPPVAESEKKYDIDWHRCRSSTPFNYWKM